MKWFKHMSNATHNHRLITIKATWGLWGLGAYWDLVQRVADQYDAADKVPSAVIPLRELCESYAVRRQKLCSYLTGVTLLRGFQAVIKEDLLHIEIPSILKHKDIHTRNLAATEQRLSTRAEKSREEKSITPQTPPDMSVFGEHETIITELIDDLKKQAPQPVKNSWLKTTTTKIANQPREVVAIQARKFLDDYGGTGKGIGYFLKMVKSYHAGPDKNGKKPDDDNKNEEWEYGIWRRDKNGKPVNPGY